MQLAAALQREDINLGEPMIIAQTGWTTGDLIAAMDQAELAGSFDLVSLLIGVNNQFQHRDPEVYRRDFIVLLNRSIALAGNRPSHVLVLSIPDWGVTPFADGSDRAATAKSVDEFNVINRAESRKLGVRYINITPESRTAATQPSLLADDELHPSAKMYGEWVGALLSDARAAIESH